MAKWIIKENDANIKLMSEMFNISKTVAYTLANRNIRTKNNVIRFLNPILDYFHDTSKMKDVEKAISIIKKARNSNDKIIIYGDYDVDGVTSTTILYKGLQALGCNVDFYIPHREKDGYGLNKEIVMDLKEIETDLLITCDNGIAALEEIALAKSLNMKVIVIDHHEPGFIEGEKKIDVIPNADAVIDPKQQECNYPFKEMCAAGISYKFIKEFYKVEKIPFDKDNELLIFTMLGTFCDVVDLIDENRIIVKNGLYFANNFPIVNLGLKSLLNEKKILGKKLNSFDMGFIIGPCINASGRLESATLAVELFLTHNEERAKELAKKLSDLNEERKKMTTEAVDNAIVGLLENPDNISNIIIVYDENIHESIAGIVAGRIKEIFFHPTIVLTKGLEFVKGSGRSIEGYNMFENLYEQRKLFERFGGHAMAAGMSLKEENITVLHENLNKLCKLKEEDFTETIYIDKELKLVDATFLFAEELNVTAPYGKGNREPLFLTNNVHLEDIRVIEDKNTILFTFAILDTYRKIKGVCFGKVEYFKRMISSLYDENTCDKILKGMINDISINMNIVYTININEFNNNISVQLMIKDFVLT